MAIDYKHFDYMKEQLKEKGRLESGQIGMYEDSKSGMTEVIVVKNNTIVHLDCFKTEDLFPKVDKNNGYANRYRSEHYKYYTNPGDYGNSWPYEERKKCDSDADIYAEQCIRDRVHARVIDCVRDLAKMPTAITLRQRFNSDTKYRRTETSTFIINTLMENTGLKKHQLEITGLDNDGNCHIIAVKNNAIVLLGSLSKEAYIDNASNRFNEDQKPLKAFLKRCADKYNKGELKEVIYEGKYLKQVPPLSYSKSGWCEKYK